MDRPFRKRKDHSSGLPAASQDSTVISRSVARATLFHLEEAGSSIPQRIQDQLEHLYADLLRDLSHEPTDSTIVMTADQLRGIVASALITGAAQASLPDEELAPEVDNQPPPVDILEDPTSPAWETA